MWLAQFGEPDDSWTVAEPPAWVVEFLLMQASPELKHFMKVFHYLLQ